MSTTVWLTARDAAARLTKLWGRPVAYSTIKNYLKSHDAFPNAVRFGRAWAIPLADLESFEQPKIGRKPKTKPPV